MYSIRSTYLSDKYDKQNNPSVNMVIDNTTFSKKEKMANINKGCNRYNE